MLETTLLYLWGGLGNQLFQYAAGLTVAEATGSRLILLPAQDNIHSTRDYRPGLMPAGRTLESFGYDTPITPDTMFWPSNPHQGWSPYAIRAQNMGNARNLLLRGYFQYLPAIESQVLEIRNDILTRFAEVRRGLATAYRVENREALAFLHVRRGDYLGLQDKGFHILGPEYYIPAIEAVERRRTASLRWLIVSDDPAWLHEQSWLPHGAEVIEGLDEVATLLLLSLCEGGAVLSNSTFNWWGAILSGSSNVAYPSRWIGEEEPELFPSNWIRIRATRAES